MIGLVKDNATLRHGCLAVNRFLTEFGRRRIARHELPFTFNQVLHPPSATVYLCEETPPRPVKSTGIHASTIVPLPGED